jgi:hypothetical protein
MKHSWKIQIGGWGSMSRTEQRQFLALVGDVGGEWWGGGNVSFAERQEAQICYEVIELNERTHPRFIFCPSDQTFYADTP